MGIVQHQQLMQDFNPIIGLILTGPKISYFDQIHIKIY